MLPPKVGAAPNTVMLPSCGQSELSVSTLNPEAHLFEGYFLLIHGKDDVFDRSPPLQVKRLY